MVVEVEADAMECGPAKGVKRGSMANQLVANYEMLSEEGANKNCEYSVYVMGVGKSMIRGACEYDGAGLR